MNQETPERELPKYEALGHNGFTLRITDTQLRKSTINANRLVREALSSIIDYADIEPGAKVFIPCKLKFRGETTQTRASFLIPKRRSKTSPEPRFWPYKLSKFASSGDILWIYVNNGELEISDHDPT